MTRPVVFISHTSRLRSAVELEADDSTHAHQHRKRYVRALLDALVRRLDARGVEPWRDRLVIEPGDDFQREIAYGLARCDAGIVIVDRDALHASFMRDETVFLAWRNLIEDGFQLLPVLVGGVSAIDFNNSPLGAAAGVAARTSALVIDGKASFRTAEDHARQIDEAVRVHPLDDPIAQGWVDEMEHLLSRVPKFSLDRAAAALGFEPAAWRAMRKHPRVLSAALLHATLVDGIKVFGHVRDQLGGRDRRRLGQLLTPLWVELPTAAAMMGTAIHGGAHRFGVGASSLELAEHAVQRGMAQHHGLHMQKLPSTAGESGADELVVEFDRTLRARVGLLPDATPEEIAADLEQTETVVFALVAADGLAPGVLQEVLAQLSTRFPGFIFVLVAPTSSRAWHSLPMRRHALTRDNSQEREVLRQVELMRARIRDDID